MELYAVSSAVINVLLASFSLSFAASSDCAQNHNSNNERALSGEHTATIPHAVTSQQQVTVH